MKRIAALTLALLAGCTTTDTGPVSGARPNLKEAARLNADMGLQYMRQGDLDLAQEKLKHAVELDPDLAAAHSGLALVYARKGDVRQARNEYDRALDLNSDDPDTLNNFAVFLCSAGEREQAEKRFLKAAKNPEYATPAVAWTNAGVCARGAKQIDKAEGHLREALRINPQYPEALGQMAWIAFQKKDYLRTRAFLQRYESVAKPTAETLWLGAATERVLGDRMAELSYERRLRTQFPDAPETFDLLKKTGRP
ncbi:MAG TPA: type IV pilus biogenesis/stability protein PilW [Candidatus Binatia bacterium]|nr:type IV pilus biogenesis/stability protein PilW [Candidatus Binatia bacterium]